MFVLVTKPNVLIALSSGTQVKPWFHVKIKLF